MPTPKDNEPGVDGDEANSAEISSDATPSDSKASRLPVIIGLIAICGLAFGLVWMQGAKYEPVLVGKLAPDFALQDLNGETIKLSDYHGQVVFLNFWATWCKPCQEEMPSMERLHQDLEAEFSDRFVMLAVSIDKSADDIPAFMAKHKLTFPVLHDRWGKVDRIYKIMGVPETYIIDQTGVLVEKVIGPRDWNVAQNIQGMLDLLRNGPKPSTSGTTG